MKKDTLFARCLHFIPADNRKLISKVPLLEVDQIIFDLEDAVSDERKQLARRNIEAFYQ